MFKDYKDFIVITNRKLCQGDYLDRITSIVAGGPKAVILREKDLSKEEYFELAKQVLNICQRENVPLYIHSHTDIARELNCTNIHLSIPGLQDREDELSYFDNISVSCHSISDVCMAQSKGASQIILGTIFETECKKGKIPSGLSFVKDVTNMCDLPIYAIGGIKPENIEDVKRAGASGGCMMSWFMERG